MLRKTTYTKYISRKGGILMMSDFYFLLWIDVLSILFICVGYGSIDDTKHNKDISGSLLVCTIVSFVVGVVFWINISIIFNL